MNQVGTAQARSAMTRNHTIWPASSAQTSHPYQRLVSLGLPPVRTSTPRPLWKVPSARIPDDWGAFDRYCSDPSVMFPGAARRERLARPPTLPGPPADTAWARTARAAGPPADAGWPGRQRTFLATQGDGRLRRCPSPPLIRAGTSRRGGPGWRPRSRRPSWSRCPARARYGEFPGAAPDREYAASRCRSHF